ncbi:MAG: AbrB/MazE/SpoVT family DNA-binding domain-containing protein [Lachnospiraceae bacterium]|nr:AbrB/MazE/SpoVT family DNA-binding domain-containing protein [Lachnospiraceae bacterium]
MNTQIVKWGNSQGIRLTKELLETAGINVNDEVILFAERGRITIEKNQRHKTLEERAEAFNGKIGPYEEFDWGDPVGREVW